MPVRRTRKDDGSQWTAADSRSIYGIRHWGAGYFRIKTRRLKSFLGVLLNDCRGNLELLWQGTLEEARSRLLAIHGIGPETADCMLLYAGGHPVFVIDAYTVRIFTRHGWSPDHPTYSQLQQLAESALRHSRTDRQLDLWQDCHAQLVMVGKHYCRASTPRCELCPLKSLLPVRPHRPRASRLTPN